MKVAVLYDIPDLPVLVGVSVYDTNPATSLNGFRKHGKYMTLKQKWSCDAHFFCLNVNDSYNCNMNSVDLSDQIQNVYRVDHWIRKYKWLWYLLFWVHSLILVNVYIIYKALY